MATVWSDIQFTQSAFNLNSLYQDAEEWSFKNDYYGQFNYYGSYVGPIYRDIYNLWDSYGSAVSFCGPTITVNNYGAITGGTVSGIVETYWNNDYGAYVQYGGIEGISISAKSLYNAMLTASTSDDTSLLNSALAGADTFILSDYDDSANGLGGNDTMYGYDGNDTLTGGAGKDYLEGGDGNNTFVFNAVSETGNASSTCDLITDFWNGHDKINLTAIDASAILSGNNAFVFKGTSPFGTSSSGEIYYKQFNNAGTANDYTLVYIDNDSDAASEAIIKLTGLITLTASDFYL